MYLASTRSGSTRTRRYIIEILKKLAFFRIRTRTHKYKKMHFLSYHYFMFQTSKKVPEVIMSSESKLCCCSAGQWEVQATRNHAISGLWLNNNVQWTLSTKYFVNYSDRRRGYNTGMATDAHLDLCHWTTTTDDRSSSDIYDVFGLKIRWHSQFYRRTTPDWSSFLLFVHGWWRFFLIWVFTSRMQIFSSFVLTICYLTRFFSDIRFTNFKSSSYWFLTNSNWRVFSSIAQIS